MSFFIGVWKSPGFNEGLAIIAHGLNRGLYLDSM